MKFKCLNSFYKFEKKEKDLTNFKNLNQKLNFNLKLTNLNTSFKKRINFKQKVSNRTFTSKSIKEQFRTKIETSLKTKTKKFKSPSIQ